MTCEKSLRDHGCYLEREHEGECQCSPFCAVGHPKAAFYRVVKNKKTTLIPVIQM